MRHDKGWPSFFEERVRAGGTCGIEDLFVFMFVYFLRERARASMSGGGGEREGDTESKAGSKL